MAVQCVEKAPKLLLASACFAMVVSGTIDAQTPQRTTATYDDWTVSCTVTAAEKSCELAQAQLSQGQSSPTSQITIGRLANQGPLKAIFQVPPNVWLLSGVRL